MSSNYYLPDTSDGWLPLFVLLIGVTAVTNAMSCYRDMSYLQRVYSPPQANKVKLESPVTPLQARTFATWNLSVGITRIVAAYNMNNRACFVLSMLTNVIGLMHFLPEAFVFRTARPVGPWLAPVIPASVGLLWHLWQYNAYVR